MDKLVGYAKLNDNSIGVHLSVEAIGGVREYTEDKYIPLEINLQKLRELIDKKRDVTAVCYVDDE